MICPGLKLGYAVKSITDSLVSEQKCFYKSLCVSLEQLEVSLTISREQRWEKRAGLLGTDQDVNETFEFITQFTFPSNT